MSPAVDLEPNPAAGPKELSTSIDYDSFSAHTAALLDVARDFRVKNTVALLSEVKAAVSGWVVEARRLSIPERGIELMAGAFVSGRAHPAAQREDDSGAGPGDGPRGG